MEQPAKNPEKRQALAALEEAIIRAKQLAGSEHPETYRILASALDAAEREGLALSAVKLSQELDHIHGLYLFGQYYDTYHGRHTAENPETVFRDSRLQESTAR